MKFYSALRSTASYRVRIACHLKDLEVEEVFLNLQEGEQKSSHYLNLAPAGLVPTIQDKHITLSQSLAIIRYLDSVKPEPLLIPVDPLKEATAMEMALTICCDIHPINNLRVLKYLKSNFNADEAAVNQWIKTWIDEGFTAFQAYVQRAHQLYGEGPYCLGNELSLADICLVAQLFNARRFQVPLENYPLLESIESHLNHIPAFFHSMPENILRE